MYLEYSNSVKGKHSVFRKGTFKKGIMYNFLNTESVTVQNGL